MVGTTSIVAIAVAAAALVLLPSASRADVPSCQYTFEDAGVGYDLSSLTAPASAPYSYRLPSGKVKVLNVCANLEGEYGCDTDVCCAAVHDNGFLQEVDGVFSDGSVSWQLLDDSDAAGGVAVIFGGGKDCQTSTRQSVKTSTRVEVLCDENAQDPVVQTPWVFENCVLTVRMTHYSGCPASYTGGLTAGWVVVVLMLVTTGVYLGFGIVYKKATLGTSGIESVPNIEFWRTFFDHVGAGCALSYRFVTCQKRSDEFSPDLLVDDDDRMGEIDYAPPPESGAL